MDKATYTVKEVKEMLGIGENKAYEMVQCGIIPNIKMGKRYIIPKVAFDNWLANCGEESDCI